MKRRVVVLGVVALVGMAVSIAMRAGNRADAVGAAQAPGVSEARYENGTNLVLPDDYREWAWVSSGLGMTYEGEAQRPGAPPTFTNVFVNPTAYRGFMDTGVWPDQTVFVLEFRRSESQGSINTGGHFQGALVGVEAEVKDARFPDGWAFFNFGSDRRVAEPIEDAARCVECHTKHTAVERTFVQFYPTLLEAARRHGTVKPGF